MVKKYTDNYRLDIAYATIFRNLNAIEEIPIHTALKITSGDNLTKNDMIPGDYIVYGGGGETGSTHAKFNIDYKTIGIGRVGARCGCVFEIVPNSWVTDNALMIQSYDKRFSLDFLRHFLSYSDLGQYANNAMQPVISKTRIKDVAIPLIDIQEQNALSKILDSIEKNEKFESNDYNLLKSKIKIIDNWETLNVEIKIQNDLTAQLKQSILQEAIQGKLTADWRKQNPNSEPASELLKRIKAEKAQLIKDKKIKKEKALPPIIAEEIPFELPEGWIWCRLGVIGFTQTGTTPPKNDSSNYGDFIPFIQPSNISADGLNFNCISLTPKGLLKSRFIQKYSNLMVCIGGSAGKTCYNDIDVACNQQINTITGFTGVFYKYLDIALKSPHFQGLVWSKIKQGSTPILNKGRWCEIIVPICSHEEQKAIVKKVESLMQKCKALEQEIKTSEANAEMLMQAVLKEAFEGKEEVVYES